MNTEVRRPDWRTLVHCNANFYKFQGGCEEQRFMFFFFFPPFKLNYCSFPPVFMIIIL